MGPDILQGGANQEVSLDVRRCLVQPKNLKFMSKMDMLAMEACHQVLEQYPLDQETRNQRTGLYLCVGVLPFEERELRILGEKSQIEGEFSQENFVTKAMPSLNPLTTFKCLPNMAAFHLSHNYGLKEAYLVTYPDRYQWGQALAAAMHDLRRGRVDYALVGAATHQQNPLVKNYNRKMGLPENVLTPDCGGMWLLARKGTHQNCRLVSPIEMQYHPPGGVQEIGFKTEIDQHLGPVQDLYTLQQKRLKKEVIHFSYKNDYYRYHFSMGATL
ncbi:MAG: beta-ketoacyl synthase N-terminal-like domain-containing protein [Bacteriovoracia bacterium]